AWHLSQGHGFTVDGMHITNGVQPLIALLYVPFFFIAGADKMLGLRLTFILNAMIEVGSVYLVARLIKAMMVPRDDLTWWQSPVTVGAALWAGLLPLFIHNMNGLETGLYSLLLLGATLCYHRL